MSKSSQLESKREVVGDLVIRHDLAIAQNQSKFTAGWFVHKMSAMHTPAAAASKKRALQELKDQRALGGKDSYYSMSAWQQTTPTFPWHSSTHQPSWGGGTAYNPPPHVGWGGGAHTAPSSPPLSNPGTTRHLPDATELAGGMRVGAGAAAATRCAQSTPTRASSPTISLMRALSPRAKRAANPDTSSATAPTGINRQTAVAVPG